MTGGRKNISQWLADAIAFAADTVGRATLCCRTSASRRQHVEKELHQTNAQLERLTGQLDSALTQIKSLTDDLFTRRDLSVRFANPLLQRCWQAKQCTRKECPAYGNETNLRCWEVAGTVCGNNIAGAGAAKLAECRKCVVYQNARGTPICDLGETFNSMIGMMAQRNEEMQMAARRDKLTGLPNRAALVDRLHAAIVRHKQSPDAGYAVLFLDVDRFKMINDSLGHEAGDQLLCEIARRVRESLRDLKCVRSPGEDVTVSRLGGDEFVILLNDLHGTADASQVAARILKALNQPHNLNGNEIVCTASIGIVTSDCGHNRAEEVLRDADTAMYEAKLAGKGRAVVFDRSMRERVKRKLELENLLRKSIETGHFVLHYQPIVSLETGKVESLEALIRWEHPEYGTIAPGEFIPLAEETGLVTPLGEWVFRQACKHLAGWQKLRGADATPAVSVNLSRNQLAVPSLATQLHGIAIEAGVDPSCIHLEVTESTIMADTAMAIRVLQELKSAGFKIDMDDFGSGYSSLSCLHQFPIDVLKIDRSFIADMNWHEDFTAMVNAIVMLAENLSIGLVAEGVETEEHVMMLQGLGCPMAQGYYFAHPMPAEAVAEYLSREPAKIAHPAKA